MYRTNTFGAIFSPSVDPPAYFHHARPDGLARLVNARNMPRELALTRGAAGNKSAHNRKPVPGGNPNEFDSWEEPPDSRVHPLGSVRTLTTAAEVLQTSQSAVPGKVLPGVVNSSGHWRCVVPPWCSIRWIRTRRIAGIGISKWTGLCNQYHLPPTLLIPVSSRPRLRLDLS
jgi:hypothetical protein